MDFREACAVIIRNKSLRVLNYAVNYAQYGLSITDPGEQRIQALYILNNLSAWRGPEAPRVRLALKQTAGIKLTKKEKEALT